MSPANEGAIAPGTWPRLGPGRGRNQSDFRVGGCARQMGMARGHGRGRRMAVLPTRGDSARGRRRVSVQSTRSHSAHRCHVAARPIYPALPRCPREWICDSARHRRRALASDVSMPMLRGCRWRRGPSVVSPCRRPPGGLGVSRPMHTWRSAMRMRYAPHGREGAHMSEALHIYERPHIYV